MFTFPFTTTSRELLWSSEDCSVGAKVLNLHKFHFLVLNAGHFQLYPAFFRILEKIKRFFYLFEFEKRLSPFSNTAHLPQFHL